MQNSTHTSYNKSGFFTSSDFMADDGRVISKQLRLLRNLFCIKVFIAFSFSLSLSSQCHLELKRGTMMSFLIIKEKHAEYRKKQRWKTSLSCWSYSTLIFMSRVIANRKVSRFLLWHHQGAHVEILNIVFLRNAKQLPRIKKFSAVVWSYEF